MQYRRFGKTDLYLSVFSLGTMRCLSGEDVFERTLHRAIELGINHIETARGYGQAEIFLGNCLRRGIPVPREKIYLTTKVTPSDRASMRESIENSIERLRVDYLDCLAIHGINTGEHLRQITDPNGCMDAVREAKKAGLIRHVGFSTHAPLEIILETLDTDFFDFVNIHYYYFFQRHERAIERARQKDMGIFIISPADKGGRLYTPPDTLRDLCAPFSPLALNYRFLLSDPRITTLSVGPANPDELIEPNQVADATYPLTEEEKDAFDRLETHLSERLGTEKCSQCYQCLPCPEDIAIPEVLRLRNLAVGYGMTDFGQYRYRMFENAGHWFPGRKANHCTHCGDCLPRCPEKLDIPALLLDTHRRLNGSPRRRLWES
ncbi:aldo/keto reductase [Pannus brasiliensis CCIBt3594]|uniref:Aldo/keto reductase n=1 Tax=Pannus brasiliensis CCIBt3594 TaxID=1427578 RepID=A0AAW9R116_9CHRO